MNVRPSHAISPQDQPTALLHCPPSSFSLGPRLHHGPIVLHHRPSPKPQRDLSADEQQELRRKINSRERKRMQDLNIAMDALREVMVPYASNPTSPQTPGRRLSKISTLVLARNYILLLGSSLQEMRRLLGEVSGMGVGSAPVPRLLLTGGWPVVSNPAQILLTQESFIAQSSSSASSNGKCPVMAPHSGAVETMLVPGQWGSVGGAGGNLCPCGVCRLPRFNHATMPTRFPK